LSNFPTTVALHLPDLKTDPLRFPVVMLDLKSIHPLEPLLSASYPS